MKTYSRQAIDVETQTNIPIELAFTAAIAHGDPFNEVQFDVVFTDPAGASFKVPGFWAGGAEWKARYASPLAGEHRWRSESSAAQDAGLHGLKGSIRIDAYEGENHLFQHGPVRAVVGQRHLEHLDGTPFFWLADTWWTGLSHRLQWPEEFKRLAEDRKKKGFNTIQFVAGLYPDMHPFDPRGAGDGGFPWEPEYARIRPEYFDAVDPRIEHLVESGLLPCLVGAWGYYLEWLGPAKAKAHWRYLIARYGAWPIAWFAAGESNLPWYLSEGFPREERSQVAGWSDIMRSIRATDPFHRPLTVHPTAIKRYTARYVVDDPAVLDFDILQTPHGQRAVLPITIQAVRDSYAESPTMTVINSEGAYEMLADKLGSDWARATFWVCVTNGAAGHTYGANGIWQLNRPGDPHGPSPHHGPGNGYGAIAWQDAMKLAGSSQVAAGGKFLQSIPWPELVPMPEAVAWADEELSRWVWFQPSAGAAEPETSARYFRWKFEVPADVRSATLQIIPADLAAGWLNGKELPMKFGDGVARSFRVEVAVQCGANVLGVRTDRSHSPFVGNADGFAAMVDLELADGGRLKIGLGEACLCSAQNAENWQASDFEDSGWTPVATSIQDALIAPQCCGIGDRLRLIYVIDARAIRVRNLAAAGSYKVTHFDPVQGQQRVGPSAMADESGSAHFTAPDGGQDWVLLLEKAAE